MSPPTSARRARRAALTLLAAVTVVAGSLASTTVAQASPAPHASSRTSTAHTSATTARPATAAPVRRSCAAATPHHASCLSLFRTDVTARRGIQSLAAVSGYGPADLKSAYALPSGGSGQTVAIVDAFDDPNAESDLATYRSQFGLPACTTANGCFRKVNQTGGTNYPAPDAGWAGEISLDVDMVSAVCPSCHILLVEATNNSNVNLGIAVNEAVSLGAKYVSNSYGGPEDPSETSEDSQYFNHPGVVITASTGDFGFDDGTEHPAVSPGVTAVGGTSLTRASNTRGWSESVWWDGTQYGTGSGCSSFESKPSWQHDTGCSKKSTADVSAVADPNTGVAVYDTYQDVGWGVAGGTSASAPIIASVYALAGTPAAGTNPASYPYAHTGNLNDVTTGSNGSSCTPTYECRAAAGYDGPTGLGTPIGTAAFTNGGGGGNTVTVTNPGNQSTAVGSAASLQIHATDSASGQTLTYSATGLPTGLSINASTGLISGTATSAGSYNVTVTARDTTNASGSTSFTWTVGSGGGCSSPGNKVSNGGFESGTTPWTTSAGVVSANGGGETAHAGTHFAWLDGYGATHTDSATQSVTIPSGCSASLTFYLHIDTAESGSTAFDKLTVKAGSTTLGTFSNANAAAGYAQKTFNVSSLAGQTVTLSFSGTEDSTLQTSFVIDDVALNAS